MAIDSIYNDLIGKDTNIQQINLNQAVEEESIDNSEQQQQRNQNFIKFVRFIANIFPQIIEHFNWYGNTQLNANKDGYHWKGRTQGHCLASGLDDYPRATNVTNHEGHLDLESWMIYMNKIILKIAKTVISVPGYQALKDVPHLKDNLNQIGQGKEAKNPYEWLELAEFRLETLEEYYNDKFWNNITNTYCDYVVAYDIEQPDKYLEDKICHNGYVTLYPLLLIQLAANDTKLEHLLNLLSDKDEIWSDYGLLSLSKKSDFFHQGEDYWRGNIWININYLAVRALYKYGYELDGPYQKRCQQLYQQLRTNLVENISKNYFKKVIYMNNIVH